MKWSVQVLSTVPLKSEPACRRALDRVFGNAMVAGLIAAFELGETTSHNDPDIATTSHEIEALCVVDAETKEAAGQRASEAAQRFGVDAGQVIYFETTDDITLLEDDDVESMDEVPAS